MQRKRHTTPEAILGAVITALEQSDEPLIGGDEEARAALLTGYRAALHDVLLFGPLLCTDAVLKITTTPLPDPDVLMLRALSLQLLRSAARGVVSDASSSPIGTSRPFVFAVRAKDHRALIHADGDVRDLIVLQLVMLLGDVGLNQVRLCAAADCGRLFVKTYRREFCSVRCQKRINAKVQRQQKRETRERQARLRRRKGVWSRG